MTALAVLCLGLIACGSNDETAPAGGAGGSGGVTATGGSGGGPPPPLSGLGRPDCKQLSCLACAHGNECADHGPFIEGTCCAVGDALVALGQGDGSEVVDIEVADQHAFLCGGFGVRVSDVSDPAAPVLVGSAAPRCQRIGIGEKLGDGSRVFYLTHHGDSWVPTPFLGTYLLHPGQSVEQIDKLEDATVSFEGMAYAQGALYVAAHDGGVRVYQTDAQGKPTLAKVLTGFGNAWKIDVDAGYGYVADADNGLVVLSLKDPLAPTLVGTVPTLGSPRDVDVDAGKIYVAMGGGGVDIFDATDPAKPSHAGSIEIDGSAQAVSAAGGRLAVAGWSHVAVYDATRFTLLATERTRDKFEQDLGVSMVGDLVFVGEWEGLHSLRYRPGYVAPDISLPSEVLTIPAGVESARAVVVKNRGQLPLQIPQISATGTGLSLDVTSLTVAPGNGDYFQLLAKSPPSGVGDVTLQTNDPDPMQALLSLPLEIGGSYGIGVGDALTSAFGFLDPNGGGQLSALKSKVVMLSYFALF